MASSHFSAPTRASSMRYGLRNTSYRPQVDRAQSNPAPSSNAKSNSKSQYSVADADSSDDEIPVPMKLSALTKALLNDDAPEPEQIERASSRIRTRAQSHRPSSPATGEEEIARATKRRSAVSNSVASLREERRHTRASSAQLSSRPNSPAMSQGSHGSSPVRKRIVRLSSTPGSAAHFGQVEPSKRRSSSLAGSQKAIRPPSRESQGEERANGSYVRDMNTPVGQAAKSVRIAAGSSDGRSRAGSSGILSKRADTASHPPSENEAAEDPAIAHHTRSTTSHSSGSRPGSHRTRARGEDQAMQASVRVRRVSKIPGSFLSGPARRGRRRQSEEEAENEGEQAAEAHEEPQSQMQRDLIDLEPVGGLASSYVAPDRLATGSPVSAKNSSRIRQEPSMVDRAEGLRSRQSSPDRGEIAIPNYRIPPPKPDMPSRNDQENEAPPTFKRNKAVGVLDDLEKVPLMPLRPLNADSELVKPSSVERKPLAPLGENNNPRRAAPPPPPKMSILEAATSTAGAATTKEGSRKRNYLKVNGKYYSRIDSLGRGGSAKVYRVAADNGKMFALKRVSIENADEQTVTGYKGEINLLTKLKNVDRVINLYDYEMNDEKHVLSLLMEMGELDLNSLLRIRVSPENAKFDPVFVRYYWQEMLECLAAVHAHDIVHSDLKPANFVLVQGRLKLIDFGIANAIQTDETVNVHRETQIGTPNYMSPESLLDSNTVGPDGQPTRVSSNNYGRPKLMKLGKPSDIWSLGCILYQMVYGQPPFGHIPNQMNRCRAIIDWDYGIVFRERGMGDVPVPPSLIRTMKRCLTRDQHLRPTCEELLSMEDPFLYPVEVPEGQLPLSQELLGRIIQSVVQRCRERMPTEAEALSVWPSAYWASVAKAMGKEVPRN